VRVGLPRRTFKVDPLESPVPRVVLEGILGAPRGFGRADDTESAIPDYSEAILGWRVWDVVERKGTLCLKSPGFPTLWLPQQGITAFCDRSASSFSARSVQDHDAPSARCSCGIYATRTPSQAVPYLTHVFQRGGDVLQRLMGRVWLWGAVVECWGGWRASNGYPACLYLPAPNPAWLSFLGGLPHSPRTAKDIAAALEGYRVPLELVDVATPSGLVAVLGRTPVPSAPVTPDSVLVHNVRRARGSGGPHEPPAFEAPAHRGAPRRLDPIGTGSQ
jgi:hypothetical protein